eukprot:9539301-Lingulodinium_polyedra.AAC.1
MAGAGSTSGSRREVILSRAWSPTPIATPGSSCPARWRSGPAGGSPPSAEDRRRSSAISRPNGGR